MTFAELQNINEFAKNYFLNKYPGKDIYVQEIQSNVGLKYEQYYDKSKGDWQSFIIMLVEQKWLEIYERDYKIHIILIDEDGNEIIQKSKPILLNDMKGNKEKGKQEDEELLEAMEYEKGVSKNKHDQTEADISKTPNGDPENQDTELDNEDEFELAIVDDEPPLEPPQNNEEKENSDDRNDEHLIAFHKLQMTLDESPDKIFPISKKYFDTVPSLSIAVLNTRKMSGSELLNNLDYYKFITWLDKDNTRYFQELALQQMMLQANKMDELYDNYCADAKNNGKKVRDRNEFPFVGAVLVSADGTVIANSHKGCVCKGYSGTIAEHCEYLLFEKVLGMENISQAKDGTLFVTLEPCVSRISGKVPCAVRCLESGIKNVYIGTFDPDKSVKWKGVKILQTGSYQFEKNDPFYRDEHGKGLQKYFRDKCYREEETSLTHTFFISEPVNIFPFNADLTLEIIKHNEKFVKHHNWNLFVA